MNQWITTFYYFQIENFSLKVFRRLLAHIKGKNNLFKETASSFWRRKLPGDDGDNVAQSDDEEPFHKTSLTNDPSESEEKHDAPNVKQASHENTFEPEKEYFVKKQLFKSHNQGRSKIIAFNIWLKKYFLW